MGAIFQLDPINLAARLAILLICLPIHEFAHAFMASKLGDNTAEKQGRLTLNPFVHLDIVGSMLIFFAGFGWAKPVPVDPSVFKKPRRDMAFVAAAGPLANIVLATILMSVLKIIAYTDIGGLPPQTFLNLIFILRIMILINLALAVLNLLPVPPLDGSKILGALLPEKLYFSMMRYSPFFIMALFALMILGMLGHVNILGNIIWGGADRLMPVIDFITRPIDLIFGG